ncbi:DNA-3-methyladenine glycosylase family protein [Clostridium tertium]|uniref:DNA-3-methyladenine glycosylase family protein n=1 Tax=Clostridium tertium TaxID=1559 RepID=UPI0024B373EE|nr:hypothetical protein [Clostridium tertium]MDI9216418.1 hypothetical protein [Clostridium tertium]
MNFFEEIFVISDIILPYDFKYHIEYYVIYPWITNRSELIRILEDDDGKVYKVAISQSLDNCDNRLNIIVNVRSNEVITGQAIDWIRETISRCLGLNENVTDFISIVNRDPILTAAIQNRYGRRDKSTPTLFEGMMNVIFSQNARFSRIYSMANNFCTMYGKKIELPEGTYYSFPTPYKISQLSIDEIKESKVGYRAKVIKEIANFFCENRNELKNVKYWDECKIEKFFSNINGVGPYTINLFLHVALRKLDKVHIDSYVREILNTFYLKDRHYDDEEMVDFCNKRWGKYSGSIISILTTDTEIWAESIGVKMNIKSGAAMKNNN